MSNWPIRFLHLDLGQCINLVKLSLLGLCCGGPVMHKPSIYFITRFMRCNWWHCMEEIMSFIIFTRFMPCIKLIQFWLKWLKNQKINLFQFFSKVAPYLVLVLCMQLGPNEGFKLMYSRFSGKFLFGWFLGK